MKGICAGAEECGVQSCTGSVQSLEGAVWEDGHQAEDSHYKPSEIQLEQRTVKGTGGSDGDVEGKN